MIKKLMMTVLMVFILAFSVTAFTVPSETVDLEAVGYVDVEGTVTVTELGNVSIDGTDTTIEFDDDGQDEPFNVTVDLTVGTLVNGTQDVDFSFRVPRDVAGTSSGVLTLTDGSTSENVDIDLYVSQLRLSEFEVDVAGEDEDDLQDEDDGYTIKEEAVPGDTITFDFELENLFSDNDNDERDGEVDIEEVKITITIEDIDDGDEIEIESDEFDIDPDSNEDISLSFTVPLKAESDSYDILIEFEAEDDNGNVFDFERELTLDVERDSHKILIQDIYLTQSTVGCDRETTLKVDIINIGDNEEDEVKLTVKNTALGIDMQETRLELSEDPDDDNNEDVISFLITVPEDTAAGTYRLEARVYRDLKYDTDVAFVELVVGTCQISTPVVEESEEEEEEVVIVPQQPSVEEEETEQAEAEPVVTTSGPTVIKESFTDSVWFIVLLVLLNLAIVVLVIWLIAKFLAK